MVPGRPQLQSNVIFIADFQTDHPCKRQKHICCLRLSPCQLASLCLIKVRKKWPGRRPLLRWWFHRSSSSVLRTNSPSLLHHFFVVRRPNIDIVFANSLRAARRDSRVLYCVSAQRMSSAGKKCSQTISLACRTFHITHERSLTDVTSNLSR